jgi:sporulation initiation inhibitor protein Soj
MTKIIAVTNQKGGVGKTTTSINVAYFLAKAGKKTLLVDFDPQGNATSGLGIDKQSLGATMSEVVMRQIDLANIVLPTEYKNLSIAPATPHLANTEVELAQAEGRFIRLREALRKATEYDYIIVDSPPSLSLLTVNGMVAANYVLLPVQAEFYALEGLGQLLESMKLIKKGLNPPLELLGVLATMMDSRTTLSGQVHAEIKKYFPDKIFKSSIPRNIRLAEAPSHGAPVGAYDRFSKGSRAYKALAKEIIERVER